MTTKQEDMKLDVRLTPLPQRHALIFQVFDRLESGQGMVLVNDHDPKPLFYHLQVERGKCFTWDYLEEGPEAWRVRIQKVAPAS